MRWLGRTELETISYTYMEYLYKIGCVLEQGLANRGRGPHSLSVFVTEVFLGHSSALCLYIICGCLAELSRVALSPHHKVRKGSVFKHFERPMKFLYFTFLGQQVAFGHTHM